MIIDALHSNKKALACCALVNKSWLARSLHNLFATLSIPLAKAGAFFNTLSSSSHLSLFTYVEDLRVQGGGDGWRLSRSTFIGLSRLRALKSLTLHGFGGYTSPYPCLESLQNLTRLRNLEISNAAFRTIDQVVDIICAFPSVESISLGDIQVPDEEVTTSELCIASTLRMLDLRGCPAHSLISWLHSHSPPPPIQNLGVSFYYNPATSTTKYFENTLKHLKLQLPPSISVFSRDADHGKLFYFPTLALSLSNMFCSYFP